MAPNVATRVAFKNILLATDFSQVSQHALLYALGTAKRFDAQLTVVHVAPPESQTPIPMEPVPVELDWHKKRGAEGLAHLEGFEALHMYPHETVLKQGNPWPEISALIEERNFDLVVLGTHGRGILGTLFLGSVAEQVLRHAPCPVMTIGPDVLTSIVDHEQLTHLLFATDFSEGSLHALPYALSLAEESNAEITLLHVLEQLEPMPLEYSKELLSDYRKRLWNLIPDDASLWCKPNVAVESGLAADSIVRKANEGHVDLIVMGVHPAGAMANHLPWTVLHWVVRHARCPVLTVRGAKTEAI
ncbi:MAG: universal stress protein [Candidatus Korobacteraceae bacterium]